MVEEVKLDEERLTIAQAARRVNKHPATVWRWTLNGCRGEVLDAEPIGGQVTITVSALEDFLTRIKRAWLKGRAARPAAKPKPGRKSERQAAAVEKQLDAAGIGGGGRAKRKKENRK